LAETMDSILEYYNYNINWKSITRKDVTSHDFEKIKKYHFSFDERYSKDMDFFLNYDSLHLIKPVKWAKKKLIAFKNAWYDIYVVTWRPDELSKHTNDWINLNFLWLINDIYFVNADKPSAIPKSQICLKLGSEFMIDDDLRFAKDIWKVWIKVYLLDKPWNKRFNPKIDKWIEKIFSWDELKV
jgi:hypothetical protein